MNAPYSRDPVRRGAPIWLQLEPHVVAPTNHANLNKLEASLHDTELFLGASCCPESGEDLECGRQGIEGRAPWEIRKWAGHKRAEMHDTTTAKVHRPMCIPVHFPSASRYGEMEGDAFDYFIEKNPRGLQQGEWGIELVDNPST